jgi:hypothetical protein
MAMAYVERCGRVWRAHWLLADGVHYGSRSGFARMLVATRFAEDREAEVRALDPVSAQVVIRGSSTPGLCYRVVVQLPYFAAVCQSERVAELVSS